MVLIIIIILPVYQLTRDVFSLSNIECKEYNLNIKEIIHIVPPLYDERYPVASENALHSCYWKSLELASDLKCESIILPILYPNKYFSEHLACHIITNNL